MAEGRFDGVASNASVQVRIVWSAQADAARNLSVVSASLQLYKNVPYSARTYGTGEWTLCIGSSCVTARTAVNLYDGAGWVTVVSHSAQAAHASNGAGSVSISASGGISGTSFSSLSCQRTLALDAIARASALAFATQSVPAGEAISFSIQSADASFHHKAVFSLVSHTQTLSLQSALSSSFCVPVSWFDVLPAAQSGVVSCTLETYDADGQTKIGQSSASFTVTLPESVVPTLSSVSAQPEDGAWGRYVQNKSRCRMTFEGAAGAAGSAVSAYVVAATATSTQPAITTPVLSAAGAIAYCCYVIDSRGRKSAPVSCQIEVDAYEKPSLLATAYRCGANGETDPDGTSLLVCAQFSASSVGQNNTCACTVCLRQSGAQEYTQAVPLQSGQSAVVAQGIVDPAQSYDVLFRAIDALQGESSYTAQIGPSFRLININAAANGVAFGRMSSKAALQSALDVDFEKTLRIAGALEADSDAQIKGALHAAGNVSCAAALSAQSLTLQTPLGLPGGGTGANNASAARDNLIVPLRPKLLWDGSFTSGSITVPHLSEYELFAVSLQSSYCLSKVTNSGYLTAHVFECDASAAGWGTLAAAIMRTEGDVLAMLHNYYLSSHNTDWYQYGADSANIPVYRIYGLVLKSDVQQEA